MKKLLHCCLAIILFSIISITACNNSSEKTTPGQEKDPLRDVPDLPISSEALDINMSYEQEFPAVLSSDIDDYRILLNFLKKESGDSCRIAIPVYSNEDELSIYKGIENEVEYIDIKLPVKQSTEELEEVAYFTLAVSGEDDICVRVFRKIEEANVLLQSRCQVIDPDGLPDFDSLTMTPDSAQMIQAVASASMSSFFSEDNTIFFISEKPYNEDLNEIQITYLTTGEAELDAVTFDTTSQYLAFQIIASEAEVKTEQSYWTTIKAHIPMTISEKKKKKTVNTKQSDVKKQKTIIISRKI